VIYFLQTPFYFMTRQRLSYIYYKIRIKVYFITWSYRHKDFKYDFGRTFVLEQQLIRTQYCASTFISWHRFSWFLQNALIHGFLNSWFQTLPAALNGKIVFRWIFIFVVQISENWNTTINNYVTVSYISRVHALWQ
jgi:hypothetical protein